MLARIVAAIGDAIGAVIAFIPELLAFLVVLGIGYLVAKGIQKLTNLLLERVRFDKLVERGGVKRLMERSKYDASDLFARGVFWVVMLFVLQLSFGVFGPNPVSTVLTGLIGYLPNIFAAAIILTIAAAVGAVVRDLIDAATPRLTYGRAIANAAAVAILVVASFAALSQLGIAPAIVNGLFYAILAIIAGTTIIALGGSGIGPLREYWARGLRRVEAEAPKLREQAAEAPERMKERAEERKVQVQGMAQEPERVPVGTEAGQVPPEPEKVPVGTGVGGGSAPQQK